MFEPPPKITKFDSFSGSRRNDDESVEFYVHLCLDVLLEVLHSGNRRKLTKLERVGRLFHLLTEKWFPEVPFLRLNLELIPAGPSEGFEGGGLKAFIGSGEEETEIALSDLVDVPRFLRFDNISLDYYLIKSQSNAQQCESFRGHSPSIAEKCDSFIGYLPLIKASLYDSNITRFLCFVCPEDPTKFADKSTLLEHIRHILSICDSSCGYSFFFILIPLPTTSTRIGNGIVVASILEMPTIASSSTVSITLNDGSNEVTKLPVEAISNWLNRERHSMNL